MRNICIYSIFILGSLLLISGTIDLDFLFNYGDQEIPTYIEKSNAQLNPTTDHGATLGRVLFYDKKLSSDNSVACASCHLQEFAFSDTSQVSQGVNGLTGRHSMRLVNAGHTEETRFFWDERANTLEEQSTQPIQDHGEMGYSGTNGDPSLADLLDELNAVDYYDDLFFFVYGDTLVTEERMQLAMAQFIRSIQSFDTKFDEGLTLADDLILPFPNYTPQENAGKFLFLTPAQFDAFGNRTGGGVNCRSCHRPPEFDIDPLSRNNGVFLELDGSVNFDIHKSPSLRDLFNPFTDELNGPMMHNGTFNDIESVLEHYSELGNNLTVSEISQLDTRLRVGSNGQKLNLTSQEINQLKAFLKTLTGFDVYVNEKWSNPFDEFGDIEITNSSLSLDDKAVTTAVNVYPNPTSDFLNVESNTLFSNVIIYNQDGKEMLYKHFSNTKNRTFNLAELPSGIYILNISNADRSNTTLNIAKL